MTHSLTIEYDDAILRELGMTPAEFSDEARLLLAATLYALGRLSSGRAAQWCGMSRTAFLATLPRLGVPASNLAVEDADAEVNFARHAYSPHTSTG